MKNLFLPLLLVFAVSSCTTLKHNQIKFSKVDNFSKKDQLANRTDNSDKNSTISFGSELDNHELLQRNIDKDEQILASSDDQLIKVKSNAKQIKSGQQCDKILLRNGDEISAKVVEIGTQEIKYKKCDNLEGPTISILKNSVFMITYANGSKDVFKEEPSTKETVNNNQNDNNAQRSVSPVQETHPLAIVSFILGLLGFVPLLGALFGFMAIDKIKLNPDRYSGRGLAVAGAIMSIIWLIILIMILL